MAGEDLCRNCLFSFSHLYSTKTNFVSLHNLLLTISYRVPLDMESFAVDR